MVEKINMQDVISALKIEVEKTNKPNEFTAFCPECKLAKKKTKLYINTEKKCFHCFRCGNGGGISNLYCLYKGWDFNKENRNKAYKAIRDAKVRPDFPNISIIAANPKDSKAVVCKRADADIINKTYSMLLDLLVLEPYHKKNLLNRGLTEKQIEELNYKTLSKENSKDICDILVDSGCVLEGVPGFYRNGNDWSIANTNETGILIPFRDIDGNIIGIQKRLDSPKKGGKFRWLSSNNYINGCKAEALCHYSNGKNNELIIITEGGMKADIVRCLTNKTVIGVPGVHSQKHLKQILMELKEKGEIKILKLAFDMDYISNKQVGQAYDTLIDMVEHIGIPYNKLVWNPKYKGLDDYAIAKIRGEI